MELVDREVVPTLSEGSTPADNAPSYRDELGKPFGWSDAAEHTHHAVLWPSIKGLLPVSNRLSILDAGCGNGFIAAQLRKLGHSVIGIDAAPDGVALARVAYPDVRYQVASVYDDLRSMMPVGGWDLIVSSEVIEHLFSPQVFLRNMHGHLRPRGHLILTTPYHGYLKNLAISLFNGWDKHHTVMMEGGHIKFFSPRTLTASLREAGFTVPSFHNAGRMPLLWKSMVCRSARS
ncbi:MAG: class I SAM-dependent methyltransferase [Candidatus Binataceae bacterium]